MHARMARRAIVLRPEPGNARTADRLTAAGVEPVRWPLFKVVPVAWALPDVKRFDSLLVTSANAIHHAGAGLARLRHLPVAAVGGRTADAARAAGLDVAVIGDSDAAAAMSLARAAGLARPLHLAGRDHRETDAETVVVYSSDPVAVPSGAMAVALDSIALLHSPRAARRFGALLSRDGVDRSRVGVAALSPAVLAAAGDGWAFTLVASTPDDAALVALVAHAGD
ncbi:MAG TPA: uroporphyrinogen-III synthase [Sphingomonas sp.]